MSDNKILRAILVVLILIGLGFLARALWGEQLSEYNFKAA